MKDQLWTCHQPEKPITADVCVFSPSAASHLELSLRLECNQSSRLEVLNILPGGQAFQQLIQKSSNTYQEVVGIQYVYKGKWFTLCHWCHGRNIDLSKATVQQVADFFIDV